MSRRPTPADDALVRGAIVQARGTAAPAIGTVRSLSARRAGVRWARTGITTSVARSSLDRLPDDYPLPDLLPQYREEATDASS